MRKRSFHQNALISIFMSFTVRNNSNDLEKFQIFIEQNKSKTHIRVEFQRATLSEKLVCFKNVGILSGALDMKIKRKV